MTVKVGRCLLRDILKVKGMNIQQLANRLGVSRQQISKYVNDKKKMSFETALNVAAVLDVSVMELYEIIEVGTKNGRR
ncbi:helix-turn-helix transcriptional regulator [Mesobacillus subterraneus]|uniref:helix-turn-helix transcriptional regulator n=1 Tax=Mesobacillus subterraneus TaxID=285983 RepID=UPI001CFEEF42|nr:helix-turn-helix transcriptional regulator [Mesobacillus subterraneus]WLR53594.1 helix-turn-helix transcriptional regulator [Mesobacillus subterraneus]